MKLRGISQFKCHSKVNSYILMYLVLATIKPKVRSLKELQ